MDHGNTNNNPTFLLYPFICWECGRSISQREKQKTTELCRHCHHDLLNKVVHQRKRARSRGLEATLTIAQWTTILRSSQGKCFYCHRQIGYHSLTLEHLIPIAKGGGTTSENCVPACMNCNQEQWINIKRAGR